MYVYYVYTVLSVLYVLYVSIVHTAVLLHCICSVCCMYFNYCTVCSWVVYCLWQARISLQMTAIAVCLHLVGLFTSCSSVSFRFLFSQSLGKSSWRESIDLHLYHKLWMKWIPRTFQMNLHPNYQLTHLQKNQRTTPNSLECVYWILHNSVLHFKPTPLTTLNIHTPTTSHALHHILCHFWQ